MKFYLVDSIESIDPGKRIVTAKALSLAEEYLADHFPAFPVMPGVLMLEALVQSAAWLVRLQQDYAKSVIVLSAARNVRYSSFVRPGKVLRSEVQAISIGEDAVRCKGTGAVDGVQAVTAGLELKCFNLADQEPRLAEADAAIVEQLRQRFKLIGGPAAVGR